VGIVQSIIYRVPSKRLARAYFEDVASSAFELRESVGNSNHCFKIQKYGLGMQEKNAAELSSICNRLKTVKR
jgi:hypothetical protein